MEKYVRQGDWSAVARLTGRIGVSTPPGTPDAIDERLRRLGSVLRAARVARANLAVAATRLRVAARFTTPPSQPARQRFADSPDS